MRGYRLKIRMLATCSLASPIQSFLVHTFTKNTVWDAYESHQKVMGDPDYKKLLDILAPAHEGFLGMLHFDVQGNFEKTFSTGTTEIVQFTLKEGKVKADLEPILSTWIGNSGREEYYLQGGCVEKPEVVGCFVGYEVSGLWRARMF